MEKIAAFAGPIAGTSKRVMDAELNVSSVTGSIAFGTTRYAYSDAELAEAVCKLQGGAKPEDIEGQGRPMAQPLPTSQASGPREG